MGGTQYLERPTQGIVGREYAMITISGALAYTSNTLIVIIITVDTTTHSCCPFPRHQCQGFQDDLGSVITTATIITTCERTESKWW